MVSLVNRRLWQLYCQIDLQDTWIVNKLIQWDTCSIHLQVEPIANILNTKLAYQEMDPKWVLYEAYSLWNTDNYWLIKFYIINNINLVIIYTINKMNRLFIQLITSQTFAINLKNLIIIQICGLWQIIYSSSSLITRLLSLRLYN